MSTCISVCVLFWKLPSHIRGLCSSTLTCLNTTRRPAHFIFFFQISFSLLGRPVCWIWHILTLTPLLLLWKRTEINGDGWRRPRLLTCHRHYWWIWRLIVAQASPRDRRRRQNEPILSRWFCLALSALLVQGLVEVKAAATSGNKGMSYPWVSMPLPRTGPSRRRLTDKSWTLTCGKMLVIFKTPMTCSDNFIISSFMVPWAFHSV